ncbi:MAG TPA: serine hydrolase domain-containing protein [Cyclobacteriaceae bacterium]|nr:serine hydrolase domain-containing protein [Cyclobacteriaceae bacterium]
MHEADRILLKASGLGNTPSVQYFLFDQDSVIHRYKTGYADIKTGKKARENTTYHIFSITKTFTALAVLQLYKKKLLDLGQPAALYLPRFPYSADITIRQLLSHTSGIPNPIPLSWIHLTEEHTEFNREKFFTGVFIRNNKTRSRAGEKFSYSNLGYILLGEVIEKVSGMIYENYIGENIFNRLKLRSNDLDFVLQDPQQHATGYHKKISASNLLLGFFIDKKKFMHKAEGQWKPFRNFYVNGTPFGGLIGTPLALVKYGQDLLKANSSLIDDDLLKLLFEENLTNSGKPTGMCLSWFKGRLNGHQYFTHAGGGGGYYCEIRIYPESGKGSVIMFNRTGMSDARFLDRIDKYFIR